MKNLKISIILPVYNEGALIGNILDKIRNVQLVNNIQIEVIIVDDGSEDITEQFVKDYMSEFPGFDCLYLKHESYLGHGAALQTGIRNANSDYLIIQDFDLGFDPEEYNLLLGPVLKGMADVVYGSHFMGGNPQRILSFSHSIANRTITFFSNMLTNLNLTDVKTSYKLFDTKMIKSLALKEMGSGFESEVISKISRIDGVRIYETGISHYGKTVKEEKRINWRSDLHSLMCVFKYNIFTK